MVETRRLLSALLSRLPDNSTALLSAEDIRDAIVSTFEDAEHAKNHGAIGDDSADDITDLQTAVDTASTGSGIVILPEGTYKISSQLVLKSNLLIQGAGISKTTIKGANITGPVVTTNGVQIARCFLRDLAIDNTSQATAGGIGLDLRKFRNSGCHNVEIRNVELGVKLGESLSDNNEFNHMFLSTVDNGFKLVGNCRYNSFRNIYISGGAISFDVDCVPGNNNQNMLFNCSSINYTSKGLYVHGVTGNNWNVPMIGGRLEGTGGGSPIGIHIDTGNHSGVLLLQTSTSGNTGGDYVNDADNPNFNTYFKDGVVRFRGNAPDGLDLSSPAADVVQVKTNQLSIRGASDGDPILVLLQAGTGVGRLQYLDATDILNLQSQSGDITLSPNAVVKLTLKASGDCELLGDIILGGSKGFRFTTAGAVMLAGTGSPEGVVAAPEGSHWNRTDGGNDTKLYLKASGGGANTGWRAVTTAAP